MERQMFCYQCEQTAGCSGCTGRAGVCGKQADTAGLQDALTGALIGLARAAGGQRTEQGTDDLIIEGLFTAVTNVSFSNETIMDLISRVHREKERLSPMCSGCGASCGRPRTIPWTSSGMQTRISDP